MESVALGTDSTPTPGEVRARQKRAPRSASGVIVSSVARSSPGSADRRFATGWGARPSVSAPPDAADSPPVTAPVDRVAARREQRRDAAIRRRRRRRRIFVAAAVLVLLSPVFYSYT